MKWMSTPSSSAVNRGSLSLRLPVRVSRNLIASTSSGVGEIRVDAVASVAIEPGALGEALAATIVHAWLDGGREVRQGRLVRARAGGAAQRLTTPDGDVVTTASLGSGELFAAWQASGAPSVIGASAL